MSGYFSNKDHQLEAKIFSDYRCGRNIQEIALRNKVSQMKVKSLIYEWRADLDKARKDVESVNNVFSGSAFERNTTGNFILLTEDEAVLTAYRKMISNAPNNPTILPKKKKSQKVLPNVA